MSDMQEWWTQYYKTYYAQDIGRLNAISEGVLGAKDKVTLKSSVDTAVSAADMATTTYDKIAAILEEVKAERRRVEELRDEVSAMTGLGVMKIDTEVVGTNKVNCAGISYFVDADLAANNLDAALRAQKREHGGKFSKPEFKEGSDKAGRRFAEIKFDPPLQCGADDAIGVSIGIRHDGGVEVESIFGEESLPDECQGCDGCDPDPFAGFSDDELIKETVKRGIVMLTPR
jgi:hypothetical protein